MKKNKIKKYTAYCGLYCKDCIPGNKELFDTIKKLEQIVSETELDKYADFKSNKNPVFKKFPDFIIVLKELKNLECTGSCVEGPYSELGCTKDCKIRKCVLDKQIEGCWDCKDFKRCELILKHSTFHPDLLTNLEVIKENGIENWLDKRGKHYKW